MKHQLHLLLIATLCGLSLTASAPAQQPAVAASKVLLDPKDAIVLLLDHQTGLFQTVKDIPIQDLRANTVVLAKAAELAKVPILTTASEPTGPNGPLMSELAQAAPSAKYIPRKGEISAWDNEDFKKAVVASGKKTLIIAGVWTSVCVAFPALQTKAEGYNVYAVIDASGDLSEMASRTTLARLLTGDFFSIPEDEIRGLESVLTIVGGKPVYGAGDFAKLAPEPPPAAPDWSPVLKFGGYGAPLFLKQASASHAHAHTHSHGLEASLKPTAGFFGLGCDCFAF